MILNPEGDIVPERIPLVTIAIEPPLFNGEPPKGFPPNEGFQPALLIDNKPPLSNDIFLQELGRSLGNTVGLGAGLAVLNRLADPETPSQIVSGLRTPVSRRILAQASIGAIGLALVSRLPTNEELETASAKGNSISIPIAGDPNAGPTPEMVTLNKTATAGPTVGLPTITPPASETPASTPTPDIPTNTPESTRTPTKIETLRKEFPIIHRLSQEVTTDHPFPFYTIRQAPPGMFEIPEGVEEYCVDMKYRLKQDVTKLKVGEKYPFDFPIATPHGYLYIGGYSTKDENGKITINWGSGQIKEAYKPGNPVADILTTTVNEVDTCTRFDTKLGVTHTVLLFKLADGSTIEYPIDQTLETEDPRLKTQDNTILLSLGEPDYSEITFEANVRLKGSEDHDPNDTTPHPGTAKIIKGEIISGLSQYVVMPIYKPLETVCSWFEYFANKEYVNALRGAFTIMDMRMFASSEDTQSPAHDKDKGWKTPVRNRIVAALNLANQWNKGVILSCANTNNIPKKFDINTQNGREGARRAYFDNIDEYLEILSENSSPDQEKLVVVYDAQDGVVGPEDIFTDGTSYVAEGIKRARAKWQQLNTLRGSLGEDTNTKFGARVDLMSGSSDDKSKIILRHKMVEGLLNECEEAGLSDIFLDIGAIIKASSLNQSINGIENSLSRALTGLNLQKKDDEEYLGGTTPLIGRLHLDLVVDFADITTEEAKEKQMANITLTIQDLLSRLNIAVPVSIGFRHPSEARMFDSLNSQEILSA